MVIEILLIILFIALSGFFSGIEIAFISSDRLRIELERKKGSPRGNILASFLEQPSEFLGTTLVGNNIVLVILGILMETFLKPHLTPLVGEGFSLMLSITIVTTIVLLIFGEFLPKISFQMSATSILFFFTYPLYLIKLFLTPIVWIMVKSSYALLHLFVKLPSENDKQVFTKLDLEHFIKSIRTNNTDEIDKTLFQNALNINEIKVRDCMIPRNEIVGIDISESIEELKTKFSESRVSRILVYHNNIDEIRGYVHHQKLLEKPTSIRTILWEIPIVHEFMLARELMNKLIKEKINIAWVVDEFGGTAGIVTLEDILEEIFGEITDEHDEKELHQKISEDEYRFSGRLEINFINEKYNLQLPESDEYHTLSGFIVSKLANIPEQDQKVILGGYEFLFEEMSDTKIELVKVKRLFDSEQD